MQVLNNVVLNKEVLGKRVRIGVAFNDTCSGLESITVCTNYYEGVVTKIGSLASEEFIVLDDVTFINIKHIQTIIIK